jgi:hypothetical protein
LGKGSHPEPITDGSHFDRTLGYIRDHKLRGAVVVVPLDRFEDDITLGTMLLG